MMEFEYGDLRINLTKEMQESEHLVNLSVEFCRNREQRASSFRYSLKELFPTVPTRQTTIEDFGKS